MPWWFFVVVGGLAHGLDLGRAFLAGHFGLPAAERARTLPQWLYLDGRSVYSCPGPSSAALLGWFVIRPVNAVLGWFFRGFNRSLRRHDAGYGWTVGRLLRLSIVVLLVYGGLLVLTYWIQRAPTGFIPQQDQGRLIVSVQLPDSASLERTKAAVAEVEKIACETAQASAHIASSMRGMSFLLQANSPNFASMFIVLEAVRQAAEARTCATRPSWQPAQGVGETSARCRV